jgi:transposase
LYVLHTWIGWEDLPQELGFRSGMTCWRRIKRWINAGVFDDLHRILLAQLNAANEIDWSRAVIDGSHIDTQKGVPELEFTPERSIAWLFGFRRFLVSIPTNTEVITCEQQF